MKKDKRTYISSLFTLATITSAVTVSGCKSVGSIGYGGVESDETAVIYNLLPPMLGGGISSEILEPGTGRPLLPWEQLYKVSTGIREITWNGDSKLQSRTRDGNSLSLIVTVRYRVIPNKATLPVLVQKGALSDEGINDLVATNMRSNIRLFMNTLNTEDFLNRGKVEKTQQDIEAAVSSKLKQYGIEIELFKLRDFIFDAKYQDLLDRIQASQEQREEAEQKKATLIAKKDKEMKQIQGEVSKIIAVAKGELQMATIRGTEYLEQKKNVAARIEAEGKAKVATIKAKLDALSGPGGENLLKIEIVKGLVASKPNFVVLNNSGSSSAGGANNLSVQRTDTNALLQQLGLIDAMGGGDVAAGAGRAKQPEGSAADAVPHVHGDGARAPNYSHRQK